MLVGVAPRCSHVLVAVSPRLLADSLCLALDRFGDWDVVRLDDVDPSEPLDRAALDAAVVTRDQRSDVAAQLVIELPDASKPSRYGYVEVDGRRFRADVGTIAAIVDLLRGQPSVSPAPQPDATRRDEPSPPPPTAS